MTDGYTPVFRSVFTGSLCGQYPDTAAWLYLLALADKNGLVDMTPQYIASVTGMPLLDLLACIQRFLEPDPMSRSKANEGRRLELIDPVRPWGWRIVNFAHYRERARLMGKNAREVESGVNRDRMQDRRGSPETAGDRREPPGTPSHTQTQTHTKIEEDCSELPHSRPSEPLRDVVVEIPLRDGKAFPVLRREFEHWCRKYPSADTFTELQQLVAWNEANPRKRKNLGNIGLHIDQWLSKAHDKAGGMPGDDVPAASRGAK